VTKVIHGQSDEVREMVCALGLEPRRVLALTLRFRPNEIVTANVRLLVDAEQAEELKTIWRKYALSPLDDKK
jgi:hypothetical protein